MGEAGMAGLEVWSSRGGREVVALDGPRVTIGASVNADLVIDDAAVSRFHLILERIGPAWCVQDLDSRNGTFVNGKRLLGKRTIRDGDELTLGRTRVVYRDRQQAKETTTATLEPPPDLTRREHDVLVELCRPLLSGNLFTKPASNPVIAGRLSVSPAAVKQHLARLYDKFDIPADAASDRRVLLANEAIQRGAVRIADLGGDGDTHG
jgi:predicted component of type VI protein secretion system